MAKIHDFIIHRIIRTRERHCPMPWRMSKGQKIIQSLHNQRLRYDRIGFEKNLKRLETKHRYYKRVREDAPFASRLPKEINDYVDCLRAATKKCATVHEMSVERVTDQLLTSRV
jgi:hypothetical protein